MKPPIPVSPEMLRWARETAGFSSKEVARKLKLKTISALTIEAWERGEGAPTYPQLEKLAYQIYKRPLALFFFPEPPREETPKQSFRTLPTEELLRLSPRLLYLRRQAQSMRVNLEELYEGRDPTPRSIVRDLKFFIDQPLPSMVAATREYLNVDLEAQLKWKDAKAAFAAWRNALLDCGVFVFKDAFKVDQVSGFCLYDDRFPLIYVNNSKPDTRQIFTLFHELCHLLFNTGGVDAPLEPYLDFLTGQNRQIEILCNRFAADFLVPDEDFSSRIRELSITDESIQALAKTYSVSREVILRKLSDKDLVNSSQYKLYVEKWAKEDGRKKKNGGNANRTLKTYFGDHYLELAFRRYYQKRISLEQLADYLGVKVKRVTAMESLMFQKGASS